MSYLSAEKRLNVVKRILGKNQPADILINEKISPRQLQIVLAELASVPVSSMAPIKGNRNSWYRKFLEMGHIP